MGLEGRKVAENQVMFGEPLNERALEALKKRSPTANDIIKSLPESAFIPIDIDKEQKIDVKKQKEEAERKKVEAALEKKRKRIEAKRQRSKQKTLNKQEDSIENNVEETILNKTEEFEEKTILETIITKVDSQEVAESETDKMDLEAELEALAQEAQPKEAPVEIVEQQEPVQQDMSNQILALLLLISIYKEKENVKCIA